MADKVLIRLTLQYADGEKTVVYVEKEDEIESVEDFLKAKVISKRGSNETQMRLEQVLALGGTSMQTIAESDPLGHSL